MPGHFVGKMGSKILFERSAFKEIHKKTPQPGDNDWILGKGLIDKITFR